MLYRFSGELPYRRVRRMFSIPNPAAGAEISITVPAGVTWELISLIAVFTASAVVATRRPRLQVTDGTTAGVRVSANTNATASQVLSYGWLQDVANVSVGTDGTTAIPHLTLEPGWIVSTSTIAIDPGDQWSAIGGLIIETTYQGGAENLEVISDQLASLVAETGS